MSDFGRMVPISGSLQSTNPACPRDPLHFEVKTSGDRTRW